MSSPWTFLRSSKIALAVVAVTALLVLAAFYGEGQRRGHPVGVTTSAPVELGGTVTLNVSLQSNVPVPLPVRASLLPIGVSSHPRAVDILVDPSVPTRFGTQAEVQSLVGRVQDELGTLGSTTPVQLIGAAALASVFQNDSNATVIDAEYGALPSAVLSNSTNLLTPWLDAGGTLVWAGGPLGYYNGTVMASPNGTYIGGLGWGGEARILGFNLTDPSPDALPASPPAPGAVSGNASSSLGVGLGFQYNGTVYGANVTELAVHHGLSLGWQTPTVAGGPAARTSLAYLPVGNGSIYYFGGAIVAPPGVYIPEAGTRLAQDVAELIAFPFVPYAGPVEVDNVTLPVYGSGALSLSVHNASGPLAILVSADLSGSVVYEYIEQLAIGAPHAPTPKIHIGA